MSRRIASAAYVVAVVIVVFSVLVLSVPALTGYRHPPEMWFGPFDVTQTGGMAFVAYAVEFAVMCVFARRRIGNRYVNVALAAVLGTLIVGLLVWFRISQVLARAAH